MAKKKNLQSFKSKLKKFEGKKLGALSGKKSQRTDPLWDMDRDGVTVSILNQFMSCRHRFHINKVQGWEPKGVRFPIEFGNLFHLLCEAEDRGYGDDTYCRIVDNYVQSRIDNASSDIDDAIINNLTTMALVVLATHRQYMKFWSEHSSMDYNGKSYMSDNFNWIAKEQVFSEHHTIPTGRKILLRGKRDGVFTLQRGDTNLWLFETKTKGTIDQDGLSQGLHKDLQTMFYLYTLQKQYNQKPVGFLYNVVRRTQLKPRKSETPKQFAERVEQDIETRPHFYFMRWSRVVEQIEIDDFIERQLNPLLYQISTWWDSIKKKPFDPFRTYEPCDKCKAQPKRKKCKCTIEGRPNLNHYERPFGTYDSMSSSQRGAFFEIVCNDNYYMYQQAEYSNPELDAEEDVDAYI